MTDETGAFLTQRGIMLFGAAAPRKLDEVPDRFSPENILPGARSIICFAVPVPRGVMLAESNFSLLFWRFCNITYRFLDTVSNELCSLHEHKGITAVPAYSCFPWKVLEDKFYGLLPLALWARECGVAGLARSGLAANPRFGTRLLLGGVISCADPQTRARELPDPCPPQCTLCADACPVGAIDLTGRVDHKLCIRHSGANPLLANLLADRAIRDRFGFETLLNTVSVDDHGMYTCSRCLEVCPLNL